MKDAVKNERDLGREKVLEVEGLEVKSGKFSLGKQISLIGAALLVAFLLGFLPMWLSKQQTATQRDAAHTHLRVSQIQNRLATAAIEAGRGEYEQARQSASDFYTDLRAEIERDEEGAFTTEQRKSVEPLLAERDEMITLLARGDRAASAKLTESYLAYRQAINPIPLPQ